MPSVASLHVTCVHSVLNYIIKMMGVTLCCVCGCHVYCKIWDAKKGPNPLMNGMVKLLQSLNVIGHLCDILHVCYEEVADNMQYDRNKDILLKKRLEILIIYGKKINFNFCCVEPPT